jgi:hypothetical protein
VRCGGVWRCDGGGDGRGLSARRALEEEEAWLIHLEVGHRSSRRSISRGVSLISSISYLQGGADRPPPPLRMQRHLGQTRPSPQGGDGGERGPAQRGCSGGAAAGGGGPDGGHDRGGHRAVDSAGAAPVGGSQAAVVEIPDDDAPPPGWDQWGNLPAPAPSPRWGCSRCGMTAA